MHPIGFNARDDFDELLMARRAQRVGGMRGFLAQVGPSLFYKLKAMQPVTETLIWRTHGDDNLYRKYEPRRWVSERADELKSAGLSGVWLHLHNEAGLTPEIVSWERAAVEAGLPLGLNFVCLNLSAGTPEPGHIHIARPLLELSHRMPGRVAVGLHEYYYIFHNNYNLDLIYHVGRIKHWKAYCAANGLTNARFFITECGPDYLPDVANRDPGRWLRTTAPDGAPFSEFRGIWTLDAAYRQIFSEYSELGLGGLTARELMRCWKKAWDGAADFALFFCIGHSYSSGWHGPHPWHQFNVERIDSFWLFWEKAYMLQIVVSDARWEKANFVGVAENRGVNVRQQPSTAAPLVTTLQPRGEVVHTIRWDRLTDSEKKLATDSQKLRWLPIKLSNDRVGFVREDVARLEIVGSSNAPTVPTTPTTPAAPAPPSEIVTRQDLEVISQNISDFTERISILESRVEALEVLCRGIEAQYNHIREFARELFCK